MAGRLSGKFFNKMLRVCADVFSWRANFEKIDHVGCIKMSARFNHMNTPDPVIRHQLFIIHQIIHDETWLEGERRGCYVPPHDRVVRENVCGVVMRIGQQMRDSLTQVHWEAQGTSR